MLAWAACWLATCLAHAILAENGGGDGRASLGRVVGSDGWPEGVRSAGKKERKGNRVREKRKKRNKREKKKDVFVGLAF